jgi:DNA polymerase-3 subunit beta
MKLKVEKSAILEALKNVQAVVSSKVSLPVLSNILLKGQDGRLTLFATDMDVSVRTSLDAEVKDAGGITVPAKRMLSVFSELRSNDVELEVDEQDVSITSGGAFFKIRGMAEEEYPVMPELKDARNYTLEQGVLKEMLRHTSYAAAADDARALLHGVLLSFKGKKLTVVATDGRRMALMEQEVDFPAKAETDMVLPLKTVNELQKMLQMEGTVKIMATSNQIAFEFGSTVITSKLVEGVYPNFRQVIPASCAEHIDLDRESLLSAIRLVATMASDKTTSVKLAFSKNKLEVSMTTPDVGEARETMPIVYSGKAMTIAFNPDFLMDPLKNLVTDEVTLDATDDLSPGVIRTKIPFLYVIMPMRIS